MHYVNKTPAPKSMSLSAEADESSLLTVNDGSAPEDKNNLVWLSFLIIGFALLTPWNTIIRY